MTRYVARLGSVGLALGFMASPLAAQLAASPVYFSPKAPSGLTLAADFGTTMQWKLDGVDANAKPNHVGVRALLGLPLVNVGIGGGIYNANPDVGSVDKEIQFSATAALKVFSPPLVPVAIALQAGAGYLKQGSGALALKTIDLPVGVAVGVKPPTPGVSFEAWGAPRVQLRSTSFGGNSATQTGIGASAGVNLGMPMGLGLHVAADWSRLSRKTSGTLNLAKNEGIVIGIGVHYTFTIPGIPMVPVM